MHTDTSLYKTSLSVFVNSLLIREQNWEALSWLPENILFDIFFNLYEKRDTSTLLLGIELRDFELFSKLLKVGNRRGCLHKIVQSCSGGHSSFFSPLIQDYKDSIGEFCKETDPTVVQKALETGLNLGGFMAEAGYFEAAAILYRHCLLAVVFSERAMYWRVELQSRLLNCLSNYYLLIDATEVYNQLNSIVAGCNSTLPAFLLCRVYTEFSTYHFLRSQYHESFSWAIKGLECLNLEQANTKVVLDVLRQASKSCIVKREFVKAEMLIKQAVHLCKNIYGTDHAKYADCLIDYGFYLLNIDSIGPSMQVYQNALDVRLDYFGGNNLKVAVAHEDLAYSTYVLEYSSGHFRDARQHAEKSLQICEQLLPENHLLLASPKRVLALILEEIAIDNEQDPTGKMQLLHQAEKLHQFALKMSLSAFGEKNVQTAKHYGNLGRLYQTMHSYTKAEQMHLKAIQIKETLLGPDDYEVALSVGHLASLYNYDMEEFSKAEQLYLRSIKIGMKLFGPSYSGLEYDYRGLIQVYQVTSNFEKLSHYTNILQDWSVLKDEKETNETDKGSVMEFTLNQPLTEMLHNVTSIPNLAAGSSDEY